MLRSANTFLSFFPKDSTISFALKKAHLCNFLNNNHPKPQSHRCTKLEHNNVRSHTYIHSKDVGQIIASAEGASEMFADFARAKVIFAVTIGSLLSFFEQSPLETTSCVVVTTEMQKHARVYHCFKCTIE